MNDTVGREVAGTGLDSGVGIHGSALKRCKPEAARKMEAGSSVCRISFGEGEATVHMRRGREQFAELKHPSLSGA